VRSATGSKAIVATDNREIRDVVLKFKPLMARDRCELVHIAVLTVISSRPWCKTLSPVTG
jgi:hypothetical protein